MQPPDDAGAPHGPAGSGLPAPAPMPRWVGPVFLLLAVALVPWTIWLAATLPSRTVSPHWDVAWAGFDVGLAVTLALTGVTALRRSAWVATSATAAATLLVCDAWFDVLTSPRGPDLVASIASAALIELPLAGVCLWIAAHSERVRQRSERHLARRARHLAAPAARRPH